MDDLKEKQERWKMKEKELARTGYITRFGRGYGPFVRRTTERRLLWSHCAFIPATINSARISNSYHFDFILT